MCVICDPIVPLNASEFKALVEIAALDPTCSGNCPEVGIFECLDRYGLLAHPGQIRKMFALLSLDQYSKCSGQFMISRAKAALGLDSKYAEQVSSDIFTQTEFYVFKYALLFGDATMLVQKATHTPQPGSSLPDSVMFCCSSVLLLGSDNSVEKILKGTDSAFDLKTLQPASSAYHDGVHRGFVLRQPDGYLRIGT